MNMSAVVASAGHCIVITSCCNGRYVSWWFASRDRLVCLSSTRSFTAVTKMPFFPIPRFMALYNIEALPSLQQLVLSIVQLLQAEACVGVRDVGLSRCRNNRGQSQGPVITIYYYIHAKHCVQFLIWIGSENRDNRPYRTNVNIDPKATSYCAFMRCEGVLLALSSLKYSPLTSFRRV